METTMTSKNNVVDEWLQSHGELSGVVSFQLQSQNESPSKGFAKTRTSTHKKAMSRLSELHRTIATSKVAIEGQLLEMAEVEMPKMGSLYYDVPEWNMSVRQLAFIQRLRQKMLHSLRSKQYNNLVDTMKKIDLILELIQRLPSSIMVLVSEDFFDSCVNPFQGKEFSSIQRIRAHELFLRQQISGYKQPLWRDQFEAFVCHLAEKAFKRADQEIFYSEPLDAEVSLSRALFYNKSQYRFTIDNILLTMDQTDPQDFTHKLVFLTSKLCPSLSKLDPSIQGMGTLLLFRALFNRCYEKNSHLFFSRGSEEMAKLWELRDLPATSFHLPKDFIKHADDKTFYQLFHEDPHFMQSARYLEIAFFGSNPIDILYQIHLALITVHKGALINKTGTSNTKQLGPDSIIPFDDIFSLFFGVLIASDIPDFFSLAAFVDQYSPKQDISASFEYVLANLEALVLHCRRISLNGLKPRSS